MGMRAVLLFMLITLNTSLGRGSTPLDWLAQASGNTFQITFFPDYLSNQVWVEGNITESLSRLQEDAFTRWKNTYGVQLIEMKGPQRWIFHGSYSFARLSKDPGGGYHLRADLFPLQPTDQVNIYLPFTNLSLNKISPTPDGLDQPDRFPILYSGAKVRSLQVDIPFTPVHEDISLIIIPILAQIKQVPPEKSADTFRVSGTVKVSGIDDYKEYNHFCRISNSRNAEDYLTDSLLYHLDYIPRRKTEFLDQIFLYKPTSLLIRSSALTCAFQRGDSRIDAQFDGTGSLEDAVGQSIPADYFKNDVAEMQQFHPGTGAKQDWYSIQMGEVNLGPGDRLRVSIPDATIEYVRPVPNSASMDSQGKNQVEFLGPARFTLYMEYSLRSGMIIKQAPSIVRYAANLFGGTIFQPPDPDQPFRWLMWILLLPILFLEIRIWRLGPHAWERLLSIFLAAIMLFFLFRNTFGWMIFAASIYVTRARQNRKTRWLRWLLFALCLLFSWADARLENLLSKNAEIIPGMTIITPGLLFFLLILLLFTIFSNDPGQPQWSPATYGALLLFFFALTTFDTFQKDTLEGIVMILWTAFFLLQFRALPKDQQAGLFTDTPKTFLRVFMNPWIRWVGVICIILASYLGSTNTLPTSVFRGDFHQAASILVPLLNSLSVFLTFVSSGALFLLLCPLLPFRETSLKAVVMTLILTSFFLVGIGSDDRMIPILGGVLVSRFVFYLAAPLLIGVFLDFRDIQQSALPASGSSDAGKESPAIKKLAEHFDSWLSVLGGVASITVPVLYSSIQNNPIVTTYFQLLKILMK